MPRSSRAALAALAACAVLAAPALAEPAGSYAGLQGLAVSGVHKDEAGEQRGAGAGALLEAAYGRGRFAVHAEGIPPVSLPQRPSQTYGQATPQLSVFNGSARVAFGAAAEWWAGVGATVINQKTPLPAKQQVVASRLAGARYEVGLRRSFGAVHFLEVQFGGAPHLTGGDIYTFSDGLTPDVHKPEVAAEEDATVALGVRRANSEILFGLRSINFSAKFTRTGAAADRNNGGGLMFEWRRLLRR
jgi:hypothetical protein